MKIAILGATGFVGNILAKKAIDAGYEIKILVRSADKIPLFLKDVDIIEGDYFKKADLQSLVQDVDVVISTVGPPIGRKSKLKPEDFAHAMQQLVDVVAENEIKHFIHLTSMGTQYRDEKLSFNRKLVRFLLKPIAPLIIPSKEAELKVLDASNINWTSLRPPVIVEKTKAGFQHSNDKTLGSKVNVYDLADHMLEIMGDPNQFRKAPFVGNI